MKLSSNLEEKQESKLRVKVLQIQGRNFPVRIHYLKERSSDVKGSCVSITLSLLQQIQESSQKTKTDKNDILIFFTGKEEIEAFIQTFLNELKQCKFTANPKTPTCQDCVKSFHCTQVYH